MGAAAAGPARRVRRVLSAAGAAALAAAAALGALTAAAVREPPASLDVAPGEARRPQVLDREGRPLSVTYESDWNVHDRVPLHQVPELLQAAFVAAEDRRFFSHRGVDWAARLHAVVQNLAAGRAVRGASTITEQVVRLLHPRPRTLWSRWVEGFEARRLEGRFGKAEILEFYLNQVPYASRRRGVAQAARWYFDRGLDTLSVRETLALAVLVRAPGRLDLRRDPAAVEVPIRRLADRLRAEGRLDEAGLRAAREPGWRLGEPAAPAEAAHFVRHALRQAEAAGEGGAASVRTTLDAGLQRRVQALLDERLRDLARRGVRHGAALVVDHERGEVVAWCAGAPGEEGAWYDTVLEPRQPGSALKPFVYALALERGWTAATVIEDAPLQEAVGAGLHSYRNYSRTFYGPVTLREALGNSLNTPAVRAARFVGTERLLERLRGVGFALGGHPDRYGDGLALGNGEVSLFELVQAYAALARGGVFRPLAVLADGAATAPAPGRRVFDDAVASLIGDILSDPEARSLEFGGGGGLLNLPVQTAVKTGTSSDYRDAWAVGYDSRYAVGVWMGDLGGGAMDGVSGSRGPGLVLRGIFGELARDRPTGPLRLSPRLVRREVCRDDGRAADGACPSFPEWFLPGTEPAAVAPPPAPRDPEIVRPAEGLQLAMDPRIPDEREAFEFAIAGGEGAGRVEWHLDGALLASTPGPTHVWPLSRGEHRLSARIWRGEGGAPVEAREVRFRVR